MHSMTDPSQLPTRRRGRADGQDFSTKEPPTKTTTTTTTLTTQLGRKASLSTPTEDVPTSSTFSLLLRWVRELPSDLKDCARESWIDLGFRDASQLKGLTLRNVLLVCLAFGYCFVGGVFFRILEGWHEVRHKCQLQRTRHDIIEELWESSTYLERDVWITLARDRFADFEKAVRVAKEQGGIETPSTQRVWSFWGSLHYALTVITSIGYGHIVPNTDTGRALTMVYAAIGIPLLLMVLADLGKVFTRTIKFLWAFVRRFYYTGSCRAVRSTAPLKAVGKVFHHLSGRGVAEDTTGRWSESAEPPPFAVDENFDLPVSIALVLLLLYILAGGLMFFQWEEDWSFFQAVYFVFISLSTIGFGDFVPTHPAFMMATFVYLLFGLALTSMCINVVQESLSHTFKKATTKLSCHIGFSLEGAGDDERDEGTTSVEIASVHKGKSVHE